MPQAEGISETRVSALVALGANLPSETGSPARNVARALTALADLPGEVVAASRLYATPCMPAGAGPDYVNAAAALLTPLSAGDLLAALHRIEARFERTRALRWGARTLDLDLLDHGGAVLPDPETWRAWADLPAAEQQARTPDRLVLPHPRLQARAFVLVPLAEIAPDWRHPVSGQSARALRDALPAADLAPIRAVDAPPDLA